MAEYESKRTTDHETIRRWAEDRGGQPAKVRRPDDSDSGILRFSFPEAINPEEVELEPIGWDEFFRTFDDKRLALLYREQTTDGDVSTFCKFTIR